MYELAEAFTINMLQEARVTTDMHVKYMFMSMVTSCMISMKSVMMLRILYNDDEWLHSTHVDAALRMIIHDQDPTLFNEAYILWKCPALIKNRAILAAHWHDNDNTYDLSRECDQVRSVVMHLS